jgi:hypothetical protein
VNLDSELWRSWKSPGECARRWARKPAVGAGLDSDIWRTWRFPGQLEVSFSSLLFSSLIGSRAGINGVGMGFYHLPQQVEFPRAPDPPKGQPYVVPIGSGIYEAVRGRMSLDLLSFSSHVRVWQPRGSAAREGDDVMAAG